MAFVAILMMFSILIYQINASDMHRRQLNSYEVSGLPEASSYSGFPTESMGDPYIFFKLPENIFGNSPPNSVPETPVATLGPPEAFYDISSRGPQSPFFDHPVNYQTDTFHSPLVESTNSLSGFENGTSIKPNSQGSPRFVGELVGVGKPHVSSSQIVFKDVVKSIPVEVTRQIKVDVPEPVRQENPDPGPEGYPVVSEEVVHHGPYSMYKTQSYEVEKPVPYEVVREVQIPVIKRVKVAIDKPYTVWKKIGIPVKKHFEVPVTIWKPYPVHVIKHVTHYKTKNCCW